MRRRSPDQVARCVPVHPFAVIARSVPPTSSCSCETTLPSCNVDTSATFELEVGVMHTIGPIVDTAGTMVCSADQQPNHAWMLAGDAVPCAPAALAAVTSAAAATANPKCLTKCFIRMLL